MNSYPFSMTGLLLAPPPPPPPSVPPDVTAPTGRQQGQQGLADRAGKVHPQMSGPPRSPYPQAMHNMMIPPSQLSLPPPPPPPPPPPLKAVDGSSISGYHRMPCSPGAINAPIPNFIQHHNQKPQSHARQPHPYRGGPSPWIPPKNIPPGLQGPWVAPSSERPSGVFEELRPPGVSGSDQVGDGISEISFEVSPQTGVRLEVNNQSAAPTSASTYKEHRGDPKDPALPKDLTNLFEALHCKLCDVLSSSTVQAKQHYSGRPHEKKVRQWLQKWSEETGEPMPKRQKIEEIIDVRPEDLYCKVCDVTFTSVKHGEQHKMGKPHQKALRLGYSTVKSKSKKLGVINDPTGRFGIGESFQKEVPKDDNVDGLLEAMQNQPQNSKFYCNLCQISTTSQDHLDSHFAGAKHRKSLVNAAKSGINSEASVVPPAVEPSESILASIITDGKVRSRDISSDLSIYRTPSGQFYCHPCNTTVNSEKSFKEHTESKRHKFKVASFKRT